MTVSKCFSKLQQVRKKCCFQTIIVQYSWRHINAFVENVPPWRNFLAISISIFLGLALRKRGRKRSRMCSCELWKLWIQVTARSKHPVVASNTKRGQNIFYFAKCLAGWEFLSCFTESKERGTETRLYCTIFLRIMFVIARSFFTIC